MKLSAVALVALVACGPKEVPYQVSVITTTCDMAVNPFQGVQYLKVRVTGDGITTPLEASSVRDARSVAIPAIPAGPKRVVEVRAYDGDPTAGGKLVSIGKSYPFDVPDVVPPELAGGAYGINVFLRKVGVFSPVVSASNPTQCVRMRTARAGHTATLLNNGKVLVAGGYNGAVGSRTALNDVEMFNPLNNTFEVGRPMSIRNTASDTPFPKAFHTATKLPNGQVVMWGGELYSVGNGVESTVPVSSVIVYDEASDRYVPTGRRDEAAQVLPRSRHSAAVDQSGNILIVGGLTRVSAANPPADKLEGFIGDTKSADFNKTFAVATASAFIRLDAAVSPIKSGEFIAIAGGASGATGTELRTDVSFFKFDAAAKTFNAVALSSVPRLSDPGRRSAGVALLRDGTEMAMLGGYKHATQVLPADVPSEILSSATSTVTLGPSVGLRGELCAVTLPNGSVIAIGGRTTEMVSGVPKTKSDGSSTLVTPSGAGGAISVPGPSLSTGRSAHTCTLLADGSVLVLGGVNEQTNGTVEVLQDAWIYQPAPVDP
ncbi:MAG: hypothetical protein JNG84_03795 [Archangium sp.]|nr:hypothetical protein [Archangium sp.]